MHGTCTYANAWADAIRKGLVVHFGEGPLVSRWVPVGLPDCLQTTRHAIIQGGQGFRGDRIPLTLNGHPQQVSVGKHLALELSAHQAPEVFNGA